MFLTASHMEYIHDHADYGFTVSDVKFDWGSVPLYNLHYGLCAIPLSPSPSPSPSPPPLSLSFHAVNIAHYLLAGVCSTIKKARDEYIKRLNGIYFANLQKVKLLCHHFFTIRKTFITISTPLLPPLPLLPPMHTGQCRIHQRPCNIHRSPGSNRGRPDLHCRAHPHRHGHQAHNTSCAR